MGRTVYPAKRDPATGYVAQRIGREQGPPGPWVLTTLTELGQIHVQALTDVEVADWPTLYDELAGDGTSELVPLEAHIDSYRVSGPDLVPLTEQVLVGVHPDSACAGRPCVVHAPSDHPMHSWRLLWRPDRSMFERLCEHGIGHPDPDHLAYVATQLATDDAETAGVHSCDGCCGRPAEPTGSATLADLPPGPGAGDDEVWLPPRRPDVPAPPEVLPVEREALVATIHAPSGDGCACEQLLDRPHADHVAEMIDADEQRRETP